MDREAVGTCSNCGRFVCPECQVSLGGRVFCNRCVETRLKTGSWQGQTGIDESCAPGRGSNSPVPEEIKGWSWGGFLLTWIWGIGNNVWIALISLLSIIPWVGWVIGLTMRVILGIKGNEWAWQHKKWESIEHFKRVQRSWTWWGVAAIATYIILIIAVAVLALSLFKIAEAFGIVRGWDFKNFWQYMQ